MLIVSIKKSLERIAQAQPNFSFISVGLFAVFTVLIKRDAFASLCFLPVAEFQSFFVQLLVMRHVRTSDYIQPTSSLSDERSANALAFGHRYAM